MTVETRHAHSIHVSNEPYTGVKGSPTQTNKELLTFDIIKWPYGAAK